jgi:hypothetical protein
MRIDAGQGLATGGIDELAANEQLVPNLGFQDGSLLRALHASDGTAHLMLWPIMKRARF